MKQNNSKGQKRISLNKTTITKLQKNQLNDVKAGAGKTLMPNQTIDAETCGRICGDCMSLTIKTQRGNTL
jgi:hypothetical protein